MTVFMLYMIAVWIQKFYLLSRRINRFLEFVLACKCFMKAVKRMGFIMVWEFSVDGLENCLIMREERSRIWGGTA